LHVVPGLLQNAAISELSARGLSSLYLTHPSSPEKIGQGGDVILYLLIKLLAGTTTGQSIT
jgi:hypothetical protein